ncbi:MAG: hypothetical protein AAB402_00550 [Patescibacteria group bacterium]
MDRIRFIKGRSVVLEVDIVLAEDLLDAVPQLAQCGVAAYGWQYTTSPP